MRKIIIYVLGIGILCYFVYNFFISLKNENTLKVNQEFYKSQIEGLHKKEDSLNKIVIQQQKEKDSLKELRNQIIIEKQTAVKEVWNIPNSEMQRRFDERIKKHLQQ